MGVIRFNPLGWLRPAKATKLDNRSDSWLRLLTGPLRLLPDFIIIGVQKGGTTSLHQYLTSGAPVLSAQIKEVHYFDQNYTKGVNWYRANFPLASSKRYVTSKHKQDYLVAEATPSYFFYPQAPARIDQLLPKVKLILLLRNPVDRALSHYYHQVRAKRETLSFEEALAAEPERLKGEVQRVLADAEYNGFAYRTFSYLTRGLYIDQLKPWRDVFSKEQMLILKSEDLFEKPAEVFTQTLEFLKLPPQPTPKFNTFNSGSYAAMNPATRQRLVEYFAPYNQQAIRIPGRRFWLGRLRSTGMTLMSKDSTGNSRSNQTLNLNRRPDQPYRLLTSPLRVLPDFIIIGVHKGGTTSLYRYLASGAPVVSAPIKEVHYFDQNYTKGVNWYRGNFPLLISKWYRWAITRQTHITGEATPNYFFHPKVPSRVAQLLPKVKLILLLRNPVDRALSHYNHHVRSKRETLSFEDALAAEPERLSGELSKIMADDEYNGLAYRTFSYLSRGLYLEQLKRWRTVFGKEQMLILKSEDLFEKPAEVFNQALEFLKLPAQPTREFSIFNSGSYAPMNPATRERLIEYFAPHNQQLYEFLGVDFGWDA